MSDDKVYEGKVVFFINKLGYGFIHWEKEGVVQTDLFVHFSDISCEGFKTIKKDQKVSFKLGVNVRNQPKAIEVTVSE
jgi:CspA family cold shock protein